MAGPRQVDRHVFPYVDGGIDSYRELTGGAVEYPVLTGLCGFLLLHKVDSPQYTLWLLPFLVLLPVHWLPDAIYNNVAAQAVVAGVCGRASLFVVFLKTERTSVAVT